MDRAPSRSSHPRGRPTTSRPRRLPGRTRRVHHDQAKRNNGIQYAGDPPSAKLANDVIAEARPKFGRVTIVCASRCSLAIGGRAMSLPPAETQVVYIAAGRQTVEATFDDAHSATREIAAVAGADS